MRKIILIASVLFTSLAATAQVNFGLKAGTNLAALKFYTSNNTHTTGLLVGAHFGAALDIRTKGAVSILAEANYNRLGGNDKGSSYLKTEYKLNYFSMPLLFKYNFNGGVALYTGPQISFSDYARSISTVATKPLESGLNEIELAGIAGGEVTFKNGLFLTARYNLGLTNIGKREYGSTDFVKNRSFTFAIGYYFPKKSK